MLDIYLEGNWFKYQLHY